MSRFMKAAVFVKPGRSAGVRRRKTRVTLP